MSEATKLTWDERNEAMGGTRERPAIIGVGAPQYQFDSSRYPETVRVTFMDGHTEIYDIRTRQPHPLVLKNIEIMERTARSIKQGYVNQPARRRRKK